MKKSAKSFIHAAFGTFLLRKAGWMGSLAKRNIAGPFSRVLGQYSPEGRDFFISMDGMIEFPFDLHS